MARLVSGFAASLALAVIASSCASTTHSGGSGRNAIVHFSFDELSPQTVRIPADGNVHWVNEAVESRGFVVFPASIGRAFRCGEELGPYFRKVEGGFRSLPIDSYEPRRVQLPCPLAPGRYDYEVVITNTNRGQTAESGAGRKLVGTIVVE